MTGKYTLCDRSVYTVLQVSLHCVTGQYTLFDRSVYTVTGQYTLGYSYSVPPLVVTPCDRDNNS